MNVISAIRMHQATNEGRKEKNMKIWVEHEISNHPNSCLYADGSFMEGRTLCKYHKFLTQTHGKKRPPDKNRPKCVLFDVWLEAPYKKCFECRHNTGDD